MSSARRLLYILPVPQFFGQFRGVGGHVAHAAGMVTGFAQTGFAVDMVAGERPAFDIQRVCSFTAVQLQRCGLLGRQIWNRQLITHIRQLVRLGSYDLAYIRYSQQFAPWLGPLKYALGETPLIIEVNSFATQTLSPVAPIERWALAKAGMIVAVSQPLREQLGDKLGESLASRTLVVPNGVDISRFLNIAAEPLGNAAEFHVGYTGILKPHYGLEQIISAARILHAEERHIMFHLVGDGPARMELEASARGLSNIVFHGSVPFDRMPAVIQGFNLLLYTTSERHTFQSPIKMCEYMAAGRPIVAMRTPVTEWLLAHGKRGELVPIGDAAALADAIRRVQDLPDQGQALGRLALEECRNHTWESRVRELLHALHLRGVCDA